MFLVLHLQMPASFYPKGEVQCVYIKILLEKKKQREERNERRRQGERWYGFQINSTPMHTECRI